MKKSISQFLGAISLIFVIGAVIILILSTRPVVEPQNYASVPTTILNETRTPVNIEEQLRSRLVQFGVPVKEVGVIEANPLRIGITVQIQNSSDGSDPNATWYLFVVNREAELAYLNLNRRLTGFQVSFLDSNGSEIFKNEENINPGEYSQMVTPAPLSRISDIETRDRILQELDLQGMKVLKLDVQTGHIVDANSKFVEMQLYSETTSMDEANLRIKKFVTQFYYFLEPFNSDSSAEIAIFRLIIRDPNQNVLIEVINDLQRRSIHEWTASGIKSGNWLPEPVDTEGPPT